MDLLRFTIFALAVLFVLWFSGGGPESGRVDDPFIEPPPPLGTGETYSIKKTGEKTTDTPPVNVAIESTFKNEVSFYGKGAARLTDPTREYIEIRAPRGNTQPVQITGWTVKSAVTGKSATIGKGVYLPVLGKVNPEQPISLSPGGKAYVVTGGSPKGYSFRLNTCTGYFEEFQDFAPKLPLECPYPKNENIPTGPNGATDACLDYLGGLKRCSAHTAPLPPSFANDPLCQEFVFEKINYNGCVDTHKNEADFYSTEWRVFVGRSEELWKESRETILLLDEKGKTVDSVSY